MTGLFKEFWSKGKVTIQRGVGGLTVGSPTITLLRVSISHTCISLWVLFLHWKVVIMNEKCFLIHKRKQGQWISISYTLNKNHWMAKANPWLRRKFLVQWRNIHDFTDTVFSWLNQEICLSSFQQGKYCGSKFRGQFPCGVNQIVDYHYLFKEEYSDQY